MIRKLTLTVLLFIFTLQSVFAQVDSLKQIVENNKVHDSLKYQPLFSLLTYYLYSDLDSSSHYIARLKNLAIKNKSRKWEANAIMQEGIILFNKQQTKDAIVFFQKARDIFEEQGSEKGQGNCLNNIGLCYQNQGEYEKSISYYEEALKHYNKLNQPELKAGPYNNLGMIYIKLHAYDHATVYLDSSINLYTKYKMEGQKGVPLLNKALVEAEKLNFTKALEIYKKALKIFKDNGDIVNLGSVYNNMGTAYTNLRNYTEAIKYLKMSNELRRQIEDSAGIATNYINLALNYRFQKNIDMQKAYIDTASMFIEKYKDNDIKMTLMEEKMFYFIHKGIIDSVVLYQDSFKTLSNELVNQNVSRQLSEMSVKYKTEEAERTAKLSNELAEARQLQLEKEHRLVYFFVGFSIIVTVFLGIIFFALKKVRSANKFISRQQKLLQENYKELQEKNNIIEEKQKEIVDSITYARRIQEALLASTDFIKKHLPEHFVFFKPKDIVSGDFYWATLRENRFYFAVCDSTGHGVPGAFMSLLNISFLNEAINKEHIAEPGAIFNYVRKRLISTIAREEQKDGFDGVLLCFDLSTRQISYAAANNSPLLVSGEEAINLPVNKMPVGKGERPEDFETFPVNYKHGDVLYVYSDGYPDQFGGPKGKKFKYKPLEQLLLSNSSKPMNEQEHALETAFVDWIGLLEQIDDVLVTGIRL